MNPDEQDDFLDEEDVSELYEHYKIVADKGQSLLRIDKFLVDRVPNATRNRIQNGIEAGLIKVNDKIIKSNYKVKPFDTITIHLPTPPRNKEIVPENIPLDIVYEDDEFLIVNKPAGMVVHPAHGNWNGTLVNALVYHFQQLPHFKEGEIRPGLIHRIDKDTSGILVIGKTERALNFIAKQFFDHNIERTYYALVWGEPKEPKGTINAPIYRSAKDRKVMDVYPLNSGIGKRAITHYEVIQSFKYVSLIRCNLETGRTHQIRIHMRSIGHPLFNDASYGGDKILKGNATGKYKKFVEKCFEIMPRQALHAKNLGFIHPTTLKPVFFESELPEDFQNLLKKWESYTE
jgi:23S rRNA pseudouridine1911/1915/1917 synthase